jgi:CSLREA domain-containing protein
MLALPPMAPAAKAKGAKIKVTETGDDYFSGAGGDCSLREAVQAANDDTNFGGCTREGTGTKDTIVLRAGETYTRSRAGIDDTNVDGDLDITGKIEIKVKGGGRARIDLSGLENSNRDRAFEVLAGAKLDASKLVITGGYVPGLGQPGTGGGAIRNLGRLVLSGVSLYDNVAQRAADGCGCGGGIENRGRMKLQRVTITHNLTTYDGGGILDDGSGRTTIRRSAIEGNTAQISAGGGIYASGPLHIVGSTVSGNDAGLPATNADGGGLYVAAPDNARVEVTNSTISGNRASDGGGGIFKFSGPLVLNAVTLTGNTADFVADGSGHGGGIDGGLFGATLDNIRFKNSIVAGNMDLNTSPEPPDCSRLGEGAFGNHDLLLEAGGCEASGSDVTTSDAKLGFLLENGGPTRTHALLKGSPAIGKAGKKSAPKRDQRGVRRDKHPDIGAYER